MARAKTYIEVPVRLKKSYLKRLLKDGDVKISASNFERLAADPKFIKALADDMLNVWGELNGDGDANDIAQGLITGEPPYWDGVNEQKATGLWKRYDIKTGASDD